MIQNIRGEEEQQQYFPDFNTMELVLHLLDWRCKQIGNFCNSIEVSEQ